MPKVQMPQLGESVAEGTIGKWLKSVGDHVDKYEPIVEVITDKVNAEVPSPFEGTLTEILVQEGETVPNGAEIATIEGASESAEAAPAKTPEAPATTADAPEAKAPEAAPAGGNGPAGSDERPERTLEQPTAQPTEPTTPARTPAPAAPASSVSTATAVAAPSKAGGNGASANGYDGPTTPAVRKLAREHSVDLALVAGSGHDGRVTLSDVRKFVESGGAAAKAPAAPPPSSAPAAQPAQSSAPAASVPSAPSAPSPVAQGDSIKQVSPMRKAIAAQMTKALQVPVAYTVIEVDMSGVVALRDSIKAQYQAQEGIGQA